ncbi:MAG: 6-phosphogluconolactonase [Microthrixaceae bacterium]|nr:6-phosphogluconolactonase [Microthrixaceae bacterium]
MTIEEHRLNSDGFAVAAARLMAGSIRTSVETRGTCHLALSGGKTPWLVLHQLADHPLDWSRVHLWQVDERVAPDGHPDRNATGLQASLIAHAHLPSDHVHLMDVTSDDLDAAAARYAASLQDLCGGVLDIVHLGLGSDGHTASWHSGDPLMDVTDRDVALSEPFDGRRRMTLTVPCINRARQRIFLVTGAGKSNALDALRSPTGTIPANRVSDRSTVLIWSNSE